MSSLPVQQWLTFGTEAGLVATLLLVLFRLRRQLGLTPLYITLGVFQPIQVLLASSFYSEILPGVMVSPGSVVIFPASLLAVLVIYIREDALEARKAIYGIMLANLTMSAIIVLLGWQLELPDTLNILDLPSAIFHQNARVMLVGSIALFLDVILIIFVYEGLAKLPGRSALLRIYLTLAVVLTFDSLFFYSGAFYGQQEFGHILLSGWLGKLLLAVFYSAALTLYLRYLEPAEQDRADFAAAFNDIFNTLTYRQKYELERRQSRKALDEKEALFRAITEQSGEGIGITSSDGNYVMVNSAFCRMTGYSQDELLQMNVRDLIFADEEIKLFTTVLKNGPNRGELELVKKDGRRFIAEISAYPITQADRQLVSGIVRDVTGRRRMEQALRESEEKFRLAFQTSPDAVNITRLSDGLLLEANDAFYNITGYSREEALSRKTSDLQLWANPQDRETMAAELRAHGQIHDFEFKRRMKNGKTAYSILSAALLTLNGEPYLLSTIRDIDQQKKAEEKLAAAAREWQETFYAMDSAVWILDADQKIIRSNQAVERLFGRKPAEITGKNCWQIVHGSDAPIEECPVVRARKSLRRESMDLQHGERWLEIMVDPIVDEKDGFIGAVHVVTDITDRKKIEEDIRRSHSRLQMLHELDNAILEAHSVDDICYAALKKLNQLIPLFRCSIGIFDEEKERARVYSLGVMEDEIGQNLSVPIAGAFPDVDGLRAGHIIRMDDLEQLQLSGVLARLYDAGVRSALNIPIRTHENLLGSLNLAYDRPNAFTEEHTFIGRELADSIAVALSQAGLRQSLQKQARALEIRVNELQQIYRLSMRLGGIKDSRQLAELATESIASALQPDMVLFYLCRDGLLAWKSADTKIDESGLKFHRLGEFLCGLVVVNGQPVFSTDIGRDARGTMDEFQEAGMRSFAGLPLMAGDQALGVIGLGMKGERDFESQRFFLETLVNTTAVALRNTLLLEELRRHEAELEEHVARRTAELVQANKELESFSYSVSHDLRAPLRAIHGFTRILLEDYVDKLDDEARRLGRVIQSNTERMGQLIDDLLAFSRLGRADLSASEVDMKSQVKSVYEELTTPDERERIHFSVGALPKVNADATMMRQVWANLLSNAIKFSRKRDVAEISVRFSKREKELIFRISDNGAGFDMNYKNKLFGVFQRLHSAKEFEGTGVGLALVQRIIQRHGGRVWAEGEPDKGATFYFALPATPKNG